MKSGFFWNWKALVVLAGIPFVAATLQGPMASGGEDDDKSADTNVLKGDLFAPPLPADGVVVSVPEQPELAPPGTNTAKPSSPTMPGLKFSEGTTGLVKLAQGGMGEDVMRAYITNANSRFSLNPDQIIYLNDLGVPSSVVTAMIEHDAGFDAEVQRITAENQTPVTMPAVDNLANYVATEPPPTMAQPVDFTDYTETAPVTYATEDANYFYDSLAPYGSWVYMQGYGLCWQPAAYTRNHDWRPYADRGRWLYTDCGWYWQSDYSWGWAPFHYGRWYCDVNRGWMWCPNRVWGPSWVSWRQSSGYCGWAPLPPWAHYGLSVGFTFGGSSVGSGFEFGLSYGFYNFLPVERLCDYSPARYCVGGPQVARVYQQTVVVNNVTTQNRRVFVRGVDPARVETASRTPVRRAVVESTPRDAGGRNQTDRLERRGDNLVVVSPQLPVRGQRGAANGTAVRTGQAESVQLPAPRNNSGNTTGGRVAFSDRTRGNSAAAAATATTLAPVTGTPGGTRVQVNSRPETTTTSSTGSPGARGNGASQASTQNSGQRLYLPNRSVTEATSTPSTPTSIGSGSRGNSGQTIFRDGSAQTSGPTMVPATSRESTAFHVRTTQPTVISVQAGPATPAGRGITPGYFIGGQPSTGTSSPQLNNGSPETLSTPRTANQGQGQGRGNFGSNLNRQDGGLPSREPVSRIAPTQSQPDVLVPSRSGGQSFSRGNGGYTPPAQNFNSAPSIPQRSEPVQGQIYTPRSTPSMTAPSAPAPAPAPAARAPEVRSSPPPQQSAPSRSVDSAPPSVPSRGGR
jgi:hypothetical protein